MATLRDLDDFAVNTDRGVADLIDDQATAAGMGSLRRGWESGRIGAERNARGIDELAARSAGDLQRAEGLRAQNEALGRRQGLYAPEVGRVEDINWEPSKALSWAAGQFGQGVASMADPVAAATAVGGVGRLAGMLPGAAGKVGRAIGTIGGPAAAFGINQRQMAGEFANNAMQDQELMARTSPQDLYGTANLVGVAGGAMDTVIPGIIGRQVLGAGMRAGIKGMGPAAKTVLGMVGEGGTELTQGEIGRYALGQLNPNRDVSEDSSNRLNEALGGAVGGGPLIAAGAYADAGYRRMGHTADQIGTKAGEVYDLAKEQYSGSALERGVDAAGTKAKGLFNRGKDEVIDLYEAAKDEDGKVNLGKAVDMANERVRQQAEEFLGQPLQGGKLKLDDDTRNALAFGADPSVPAPQHVLDSQDPEATQKWYAEGYSKRGQTALDILDELAANGDQTAESLAQRIAEEGFNSAAADEGVLYVQQAAAESEKAEFRSTAEAGYAVAGKLGAMGARAIGKGAVKVGKGALKIGKDIWSAGKDELSKKNAQGDPDGARLKLVNDIEHSLEPRVRRTREEWEEAKSMADKYAEGLAAGKKGRTEEFLRGLQEQVEVYRKDHEAATQTLRDANAKLQGAARKLNAQSAGGNDYTAQGEELSAYAAWRERTGRAKAVMDSLDIQNSEVRTRLHNSMPAERKAQEAIAQRRAEAMGEILVAEAQALDETPAVAWTVQGLGFELADIAASWGMNGPKQEGAVGLAAGTRQMGGLTLTLDNAARALKMVYGDKAIGAVDQLRAVADAGAGPMFDYLAEQIKKVGTAAGRAEMAATRKNVANQMMQLVPADQVARMQASGGDYREKFLRAIETIANGVADPGLRTAFERELGKDTVLALTGMLNNVTSESKPKSGSMFGDSPDTGVEDDFERAAAEKNVSAGAGQAVYGFHATSTFRGGNRRIDPFAADITAKGEDKLAAEDEALQRKADGERGGNLGKKRPMLFKQGQKLFGGEDAIGKKIADLEKYLGVDQTPERMAKIMEQEGNEAGAAKVKELMARGDEKAQAALKDGVKSFFVNRAGNYKVGAKSAKEVMDGLGYQPGKVLSLYRDYLRQENKGLRANKVAQAVLALSEGEKEGRTPRMSADEVSKIVAEAEKYFSERFLVVAEGLSDRVPDKMSVGEVMDLVRDASKALDNIDGAVRKRLLAAGLDVDKDSKEFIDARNEMISEGNFIFFTTADKAKNKDGTESYKRLPIKASQLVGWAKAQKVQYETDVPDETGKKDSFKNIDKDMQFLENLLSGINAVRESGHTKQDTPPYMFDKFGRPESFEKGIPPSLQLATTTQFQRERVRNERAVAKTWQVGPPNPMADPTSDQYQAKVGRDQDKDEGFVAEQDRGAEGVDPYQLWGDLKGVTQVAGKQVGDGRTMRAVKDESSWKRTGDYRTTETDRTPLDFFGGQEEGEAPDEFADALYRTKRGGKSVYDPLPFETVSDAARKAEDRSGPILQALRGKLGTPEQGLNQIIQRIKAAETPYTKGGPAGGIQYLYPAAAALNPGVFDAELDGGGKMEDLNDHLMMLRGQVFRVLRDGDIAPKHKVAITRLLVGEKHAAKITAANVDEAIAKRAAPDKESGLDYFEVKTPPEMKDITQKKLTVGPLVGPTKDERMYGTEYRTDGQQDMFRETADANPRFPGEYARTRKYAGEFEGSVDDMNAAIERKGGQLRATKLQTIADLAQKARESAKTKAAPEVAATKAPKSQGAQSGEGFKLSPRGPFTPKDQLKADRATAFIGRGSATSSTNSYANDARAAGIPVNPGKYSASDVVFVSAEGARTGRLDPDLKEIDRAMSAGATIITDPSDSAAMKRDHNVGERAVMAHLKASGYVERAPGEWGPGNKAGADWSASGRKLNAQAEHTVTSSIDEISVTGRAHQYGDATIVEVREYTAAYQEPTAPPNKVYADAFSADGDYFSGWYASVGAAIRALNNAGFVGSLGPYTPPSYTSDVPMNAQAEPMAGWKAGPTAKATGAPASDREMAQAQAYVKKVLGPKFKLMFEKDMGHSGEFIEAENLIKIAVGAAAGTMPTAYHEALHAFFASYLKSDPRAMEVMKALAENQTILDRITALLDGYPAAQAQLTSGEERLAYIFQFYAAGQLDLPSGKGRNWVQKLVRYFRKVLGTLRADERATDILDAFHDGKFSDPSTAQRVLAKISTPNSLSVKARRNFDGLIQGAAAAALPAQAILNDSPSRTAKRLMRTFYANPGSERDGKGGEGYLNAVKSERTRRNNAIMAALEEGGATERDMKAIVTYLQQGVDPIAEADKIPYAPHRKAVAKIRAELEDFHHYMTSKGLDIGYIQDYFPVVWNSEALAKNPTKFAKMLVENYPEQMGKAIDGTNLSPMEAAMHLTTLLIDRAVFDGKLAPGREDGVLIPFFESSENRTLDWIKPEHREPWLSKELLPTLTKYFGQGVRAAEYVERFGEKGEKLDHALKLIDQELSAEGAKMVKAGKLKDVEAGNKWAARQYRDVRMAIGAMEGTLGKNISDTHRSITSWVVVYQNIRLLPLSLFASVVDPLSIVARGGDFKLAGEVFINGMKEVFKGWREVLGTLPPNQQKNEWEQMAEFIGATESAMMAHHVSEEYSSQYMSPRAKKINDMMFKLNGMESWNRAMRVGATKGAAQFLIKHKDLPDAQHSRRWLKELGLTPEDIIVDNGKLVVDKHELATLRGISLEEADAKTRKVQFAMNRWIEGAVLTPNSAQRPAWSSDPRWSFIFHLKQFTYSFQQTILTRAWNEMKHGNLAPMGSLSLFVPAMIASDMTKGLIVGGGELPPYMQGYNAADWFGHGLERAGALGYGQLALDAVQDPASLGGPMTEQIVDAFRQPIGDTLLKAAPANALYRNAFT